MAKIVNSVYTPNLRLIVETIFLNDEATRKVIHIGDTVEDLRYTEDGEIKTVTGVVADITYKMRAVNNRNYVEITKLKSNFSNDVTPVIMITDCSEKYASNVVNVPVREIIEDEGVLDVKKVNTSLQYGVTGAIELSDGVINEFTVWEGDYTKDVEYISRKGDQVLNGKLAVIQYNGKMLPTKFIFNVDSKIVRVGAQEIKKIGTVTAPADNTNTIDDLIADAQEGDTILLGEGVFAEPIKFEKNVTVAGAYYDVPVNPQQRNKNKLSAETIVSGAVTTESTNPIDINGVAVTGSALLNDFSHNNDITVKNCLFYDIDTGTKRDYLIRTGNNAGKLIVEGNYFGKSLHNIDQETGNRKEVYNLFELAGPVKDGTSISGNYFEQGCSVHNDINIYDVEDQAVINIEDNVWEKSANAIRIGIKGDKTCTINIRNNVYMSTDEEYPEYAGLVLIQPYGKQTTTMAHVTINIENTTHNDDHQLFYLYAGKNDTQWDEYNVPTIIVDGKIVLQPAVLEENTDGDVDANVTP